MKRKVFGLLILLVVGGLAVFGTSQAKPLAPSLKIGVFIAASGPLYFAGAFQKAGCELAEQDSNVSCFYADAGESDAQAKAAYKQLQNSDVDLLIAPLETESVKRVLKLNQPNPIPIIAASAIEEIPGAIVKDKNWLFRLASTSTQDISVLAEYIARDKPQSIAILVGPEAQSKQNARFLQFSLALRGFADVQQYSLAELKSLRQSNPDAVVLVSMESSVEFLEQLGMWFKKAPSRYLVQGNLANYSVYSWSKYLQAAKAIVPMDQVAQGFKESVANYLKRPNLLSAPNSPVFALAWRTKQAVDLVEGISGDIRLGLERMKQTFNSHGYFLDQKYNIYSYGNQGIFTLVGPYQPETP
ncbi:MAG: hypothetical protein RIQ88_86 [Actinomycetota bacterium]|jgi:Periplasmic binding protein